MTTANNAGHLSHANRAPIAGEVRGAANERTEGPVPMHHRLKLGQDVLKDPQGIGAPSTQSTIANGGRHGW